MSPAHATRQYGTGDSHRGVSGQVVWRKGSRLCIISLGRTGLNFRQEAVVENAGDARRRSGQLSARSYSHTYKSCGGDAARVRQAESVSRTMIESAVYCGEVNGAMLGVQAPGTFHVDHHKSLREHHDQGNNRRRRLTPAITFPPLHRDSRSAHPSRVQLQKRG